MTTMANRSSGLVQRRVTSTQGAEGGSENKAEDCPFEEDEDHDSKETRLTLLEEVLLLGLKDREVTKCIII